MKNFEIWCQNKSKMRAGDIVLSLVECLPILHSQYTFPQKRIKEKEDVSAGLDTCHQVYNLGLTHDTYMTHILAHGTHKINK